MAEDAFSLNSAAEDELVAAPGVVGAASVGSEGAAEVGGGEEADFVFEGGIGLGGADGDHGVVEGVEGFADLGEHVILVEKDVAVVIPTAPLDEEGLSGGSQTDATLDGAGDLGKALSDVGRRESDAGGQGRGGGSGEDFVGVEGLFFAGVEGLCE